MSIQKLQAAKERFTAASRQHGDADHAITWTAEGLVQLTDALIELRRDIDAIKVAMERRQHE